jgi:hypothetical protein
MGREQEEMVGEDRRRREEEQCQRVPSGREAKGKKASGTKTDPSFIYPLAAAHFRAGRTERRTGEGKRERTREGSQRCKG